MPSSSNHLESRPGNHRAGRQVSQNYRQGTRWANGRGDYPGWRLETWYECYAFCALVPILTLMAFALSRV